MNTPTAYSYVRFSTPEQAKGNSLERQTQAARDYAAARGLALDETLAFHDKGISAHKGRNFNAGRLADFVAACDAGRVARGSFLLVENLDRLSRQEPIDAVQQLQEILRRGVTVVTLHDREVFPPDAMRDFGKLLKAVVVMQTAYEESAKKSLRIAASWASKRRRAAQKGEPMTRMAPGWLTIRDGRYEVIEERAAVVREVFRQSIAGVGKARIARKLTTDGVRPFGRSIGWHPSAVQKLLENEAVLGTFQPHRIERAADGARKRVPEGEPIRDYFPAVVDEATFWRARTVSIERRIPQGPNGGRLSNLFTGIGRCAHCGGPMHFEDKGGGYTRLTCGDAKRRTVSHAPNSWRYPIAERFTLLALLPHLDLAGAFPATQADAVRETLADIEGRIQAAKGAAARAEGVIAKMIRLLEEEDLPAYRDRVRSASREREEAEAEAAHLETAAAAIRVNIAESERDRTSAEDSLKRWAEVSEGTDTEEAYAARVSVQQLLRRTIARIEFRRGSDGDARYGYVSVTSKAGSSVQLVLDDQNDEGEMRASVHDFRVDEKTGNAGMWSWSQVVVPEWWP